MASVQTLQQSWINGMMRDFSRDQMPTNTAWNAVDLILEYGAPLRGRGPWTHHSQNIASVTAASATRITGGVWAGFVTSGGANAFKNLAVDEDGHLFDVTAASGASSIGSARVLKQNPIFHGGTSASAATAVYTGLVIIPDGTGLAVPKKYDGTTLSDLGGSPPCGKYGTVYKDYTVLGNGYDDPISGTFYANRAWFSPAGDPDVGFSGAVTAWDKTNSWLDFSLPIRGFGATRTALLVFHDTSVSRIRGSVPPPDTDYVVDDPYFNVGLCDAFAITEYKDSVFWAAPEGVFSSDGAGLSDLTAKGGMLRYWRDLLADATSTWTYATGVIRNNLVVSIMDGATFKDCFLIDLQSLAWTRLSNIDAITFWGGFLNQADECYWGRRGGAYVARMDSIFADADTVDSTVNDGDGDAILPVFESPFFDLTRSGLKRIRNVYLTYALGGGSSLSTADATVHYVLNPDDGYTDTGLTLGAGVISGTLLRRKRYPVRGQGFGVGIKITRTSQSGDFRLHNIGLEAHRLTESRLKQ